MTPLYPYINITYLLMYTLIDNGSSIYGYMDIMMSNVEGWFRRQ